VNGTAHEPKEPGKGGIITAITERVNPRVFGVVALPAPASNG
jgi:polyphosphate kinase 2 (PPK2 family)